MTAAFQLFYSKEGYTSIDVNPEMIKARGIADTGDKQNDLMELFVHWKKSCVTRNAILIFYKNTGNRYGILSIKVPKK